MGREAYLFSNNKLKNPKPVKFQVLKFMELLLTLAGAGMFALHVCGLLSTELSCQFLTYKIKTTVKGSFENMYFMFVIPIHSHVKPFSCPDFSEIVR